MKKSKISKILCGAALWGIASTAHAPSAVRTLDLSSLAAYRDAAEGPGSQSDRLSLAFLDDSTIAVSVQFEFRPQSAEDALVKFQHTLYNTAVLTIDAQKGTNQNSQVVKGWQGLSAVLWGSGIHSTGASGCLVSIGDRLFSFSHELEVVATRELPLNRTQFNGYPQQDQWMVLTDPRTKKALLVHFPYEPGTAGRNHGDAHWISVDTLEDQSSISVPRWQGDGAALVGDSVISNELGAKHRPAQIQINDKEPRPLCAECFGGVQGSFGNSLLFLRGLNEYWVSDSQGTILFRKKGVGGRADTIDGVSGAMTSNRVAYHFGHLGRGLEETAVVLDVDAKKEIWRYELHQEAVRTEVGGFVSESFPSPTLALSPDGKKLAIVSGTVLSIFDIP